jgi:predicted esterase
MRTIVKNMVWTVLLLTVVSGVNAQKTGNIVEIFGKEKVETTSEGVVAHTFTNGLALRDAIIPGLLTNQQDIIYWQMATQRFIKPENGQQLADKYLEGTETKELKWEVIEADSAHVFKGNLNRAYLFTTFESPEERVALLDASGHTRVYINGLPHEGDHYDYGYTLIPFKLKKGVNQFIYTYGRFSRLHSKLVFPSKDLLFSNRDMTLPSILIEENNSRWGAIRIINASEKPITGHSIECILETGEKATSEMDNLIALTTRKLKFQIPHPVNVPAKDTLYATLVIKDKSGKEKDKITIALKIRSANVHHERTFISRIDGSVQYFSMAPSLQTAQNQALVLSVHGASVEATNQSRAYKQKNWGHIVAPTNRRPFGFNWEEWGRMDALEVLQIAKDLYKTDSQKTYLTGHSMGGHGTWFLGVTYPDHWAAIAPAAGYPDIIQYRRSGPENSLKSKLHFEMVERGASAGRVEQLARNYLQSGVYILHGDDDSVVPVEQARKMRGLLGTFHNNFTYYEYPGGSHWYGDHSVDWKPMFDFLQLNTIPDTKTVEKIEFYTASPAVSATNHWVRINQQEKQYQTSSVKAVRNADTIHLETENIASISLLLSLINTEKTPVISLNKQLITPHGTGDLHFKKVNQNWVQIPSINPSEKYAQRSGGFKLAFDNNMVFVYATNGSKKVNQWYENKARFDAETFLYRGNGSIDIIPDREFSPEKYKDRNVILYGNADNNSAWKKLLSHCPVVVTNKHIAFGSKILNNNSLGAIFIYPRADSKVASVGVVAGTGQEGMMSVYSNDYFSGITGFSDLMIVDVDWIKDGLQGVKVSGYFGNDWSITNGEFKD